MEVGKIYIVHYSNQCHQKHQGHYFLVEILIRENKGAQPFMCRGLCSCGGRDSHHIMLLKPIDETDEIRQIFTKLMLGQ